MLFYDVARWLYTARGFMWCFEWLLGCCLVVVMMFWVVSGMLLDGWALLGGFCGFWGGC